MNLRAYDPPPIKREKKICCGANRRQSCQSCVYRRGIGARGDRYTVCCYCFDTGTPRGCPPENCSRKKVRA